MTAYWLIVCHLLGDYVLQSEWMANEKTKSSWPALCHVLTYTLPFLVLTRSPVALAFICATHFVIDRWRLARYVCWLKNFMAPRRSPWKEHWLNRVRRAVDAPTRPADDATVWWHPWAECVGTGYHKDRPSWLAVWLLIIADNTMHLVCNGLAMEIWG